MIQREEMVGILKETGVMLEGHFLLTSGKHSNRYMQCAQLFQYPQHTERVCGDLAARFENVDVVIGPAMGGVIMAYALSAALGCRNFFTERQDGAMALRRGFALKPGERVLVCEDVVTTGGSAKEVVKLAQDAGAEVVGVAVIVDRSGGKADFGVRLESMLQIEIDVYEPDACPLCAAGAAAVKPGSRKG